MLKKDGRIRYVYLKLSNFLACVGFKFAKTNLATAHKIITQLAFASSSSLLSVLVPLEPSACCVALSCASSGWHCSQIFFHMSRSPVLRHCPTLGQLPTFPKEVIPQQFYQTSTSPPQQSTANKKMLQDPPTL